MKERLEFDAELLAALISVLGTLLDHLVHDANDLRRHAGHGLPDVGQRILDLLQEHGDGVLRTERKAPAEDAIERDAERVDVAASVDRTSLALLGAHVVR